MIYLNLVSEEIRNKIKFKSLYEVIRYSSVSLLIFVFFISGLFFAASMILNKNYASNQDSRLIQAEQKDSQVYKVNNMIVALEDIQNNFRPWSILLKDISDSSNSGMFFTKIKIDKKGGFVNMEGQADNRSSLVDFKDKLQDLGSISSFDFFNYDIFQKENIIFSIKARF